MPIARPSSQSRRLLGRYELLAEIASGGMGVVCLARAVGLGGFRRLFAVKVLHPHLVEDARFRAMLLDEAQLAARIHHPNVVSTIDVCTRDGCHFLVMDYVDGFQLSDVLERETLTPEQRVRVGIRVLLDVMAGLEAAHSLVSDEGEPVGLVHRDVSPQNVLVGLDGIARLTDFGIALAASRISTSRPGTVKGKPSYMAPEQVRAEGVDRRADIWALGVVLWEVFAGRRLFIAPTEAATMLKVTTMPIESPRDAMPALPQALASVCLRALERDPARRYASAREMADDLGRAAASAGLLARSSEVADVLRRSFALEIERIKTITRELGSAPMPPATPMLPRDVYSLPRLDGTFRRPVLELAEPPLDEADEELALALRQPRSSQRRKTKVTPRKPPEPVTDDTVRPISSDARRLRSGNMRGLLVIPLFIAFGGLGFWVTRQAPVGAAAAPLAEPASTTSAVTAILPTPAAALSASTTVDAAATPSPTARTKKRVHTKPKAAAPVIEENPYGLR